MHDPDDEQTPVEFSIIDLLTWLEPKASAILKR